jgi:hypothetical protein
LSMEQARKAASFLAGVVGKAHARQMDRPTRARWTKELERHRSKIAGRAELALVKRGCPHRQTRSGIS